MTDLVSVIVPACNAQATIDETLRSVRAQTHAKVEIIVVDDGSTDRTPEIVAEHTAVDERVRLLRQVNSGVAEARNRGARAARAELLAFVDADDLWAAPKIERQLAVLGISGPRAGLVYTWYVHIDRESRVGRTYRPAAAGDVVEALCRVNVVGNGSSALVTRAAFAHAGGFDPTLGARGAHGCEDWLFYFNVASRYDFAFVPEVLTGYRQSADAMSGDSMRMLRSFDLAAERMRLARPDLRASISRGRTDYAAWLLDRAIGQRSALDAARLGLTLLRDRPTRALGLFADRLSGRARKRFRATEGSISERPTFLIGDLSR